MIIHTCKTGFTESGLVSFLVETIVIKQRTYPVLTLYDIKRKRPSGGTNDSIRSDCKILTQDCI